MDSIHLSRSYAAEKKTLLSKLLIVLRWGLLLPGALLYSFLAYLLVVIPNVVIAIAQNNLDSLDRFYVIFISHSIFGASFVYIGTEIAPFYKKVVANVLGSLGIIVMGFLLFPAISTGDSWGILSYFAIILGIIIMAYSINSRKI